jgi:hypothetical protein
MICPLIIDTAYRSRVFTEIEGVEVRHIASGIYTADQAASDESLLMAHLHAIASARFPGAVVSDRSAFRTGQETYYYDRALFLVWHRTARLDLPGVSIRARKGTRHPLDREYSEEATLYRASGPRALLDGLRPARRHGEVAPRSMSRSWIVSELARYGDLGELRGRRRSRALPRTRTPRVADEPARAATRHPRRGHTPNARLSRMRTTAPINVASVMLARQVIVRDRQECKL